MNKNETPVLPGGNRAIALAMQELRRSNATVPKPAKTGRKQRSRSGAKRAAFRAAGGE